MPRLTLHQDCNGHTNQQFFPAGMFQWKSMMNTNKCLDLYASDTTNGRLLEVWDCANYDDNPE